MQDLIQEVPGGLSGYRPTLTYLLLDESRHQMQGVPTNNLVAAIFRLEQSNEPADVQRLVRQLIAWLKAPEQTSLRRAFAVWIRRVLLPVRLPGQSLPEIKDLMEVDAMLAERVKEWTHEWEAKGVQKGMQKGKAGILLRQMRLKFGEMDAAMLEKIESADTEKLGSWSERILSANAVEDIFNSGVDL